MLLLDFGRRLQRLLLHQLLLGLLLEVLHESFWKSVEESVFGNFWDAGELAEPMSRHPYFSTFSSLRSKSL